MEIYKKFQKWIQTPEVKMKASIAKADAWSRFEEQLPNADSKKVRCSD